MKSKNKKILTGFIKRHPDGFGFFIPDDKEHQDVYIPQHSMKSAMTNDKVKIEVEKEKDGRFRGEIIAITERSQRRIAGKFMLKDNQSDYGLIKDEGRGWGKDLRIPIEFSKNAKDGDLVEAHITQFPEEGHFEGEITDIIGDPQSALNDIRRVIISQNIPDQFSKTTLEEAKKFSSHPEEKDFKNRKDLRNLSIITIDGSTAKDFDDAVYTSITSTGFHLYVAIADVSHYVSTNTAMDKEAYERGNSVYFPNFVVPMLPEALSNGLCSLNPHVPRLALVAEMHFDFTGEMTQSEFYEAVIESKARVTYGEAQELLDGVENKDNENAEVLKKLQHVKENIVKCSDLAKVLMAKRFKEGSLDLEVAETELVIDAAGEPIDVIKSERLFAHRLIEELMLAANVAVAQFFAKKEIPAFYRIHEPPDADKIALLQKYMQGMGSDTTLSGGKLQKRMSRVLQEFHGKPESQIIHILTLRSMSQAKYTLDNKGHFGLGFEHYTHFTSPIRRYPDLIVHRLLKSQILSKSKYRLMSDEDLRAAGTWLSGTEQKAAKAERQIQSIKKARFMQKAIGENYEGIISSVTKFGVFVLLRQFNIDGLIRLDELGNDKWEFNEETLSLVAKRSGFSYNLGDALKVTVSSVDIEQGQINFVLEENAMRRSDSKKIFTKQKNKNNSKNKSQSDFKSDFKSDSRSDKNKTFKSNNSKQQSFEKIKEKPVEKNENKFFDKRKPQKESSSATGRFFDKIFKRSSNNNLSGNEKIKSSSKENNKTQNEDADKSKSSSEYVIKPKYSSLSDYLDQKKQKGLHEEKSETKPAFRSSKDRKDTEKRSSPKDDSGGLRKARPKKFSRKNKSR